MDTKRQGFWKNYSKKVVEMTSAQEGPHGRLLVPQQGPSGPLQGHGQQGRCGYLYVIVYTKNSYMYLSQN